MEDRWGSGPPPAADDIDRLLHLARAVGADPDLTQPGGGNVSLKASLPGAPGAAASALVVKGSGGDLADLDRDGLTWLAPDRLTGLARQDRMTDEEMLDLMAAAMQRPRRDPLPSVETPLHALLPHRVVVHVHDVTTMALTGADEAEGRRRTEAAWGEDVLYVPYARPGFPLARALADLAPGLPAGLRGLALAHHGLVAWGEDAESAYRSLMDLVGRGEAWLTAQHQGKPALGAAAGPLPDAAERRRRALVALPALRGALHGDLPVVLGWDGSDEALESLARPRLREVAGRGPATPDHILRAGRAPVWLDLDFAGDDEALAAAVRAGVAAARQEQRDYVRRHGGPDAEPVPDWAKTFPVPGLGLVTAFTDPAGARAAAVCFRAAVAAMERAEAAGGYGSVDEARVFEFEHWPLERLKVAAALERDRQRFPLLGKVALILGGGSGIGEAAAHRFAAAGAHVVVADLDGERAGAVAAAVSQGLPGRALGVAADVRRGADLAAAVETATLTWGGLDALFYTPGLPPRFAPVSSLEAADYTSQMEVHYVGALMAIRQAAAVMARQGTGGAIVCNASKAGLAPGREAAAYGGSKAALLHALRTAALELGPSGIRVNALNADQVETPLFLRFVEGRARARGLTVEQQLEQYRQRNALGVSLIPAAAVADLAVLLCSEPFRYTTGDILTIDGGLGDAFPR